MRLFGGAVSAGLPAPGTGSGHKGLKNDALGMFSSVVMGLASTGPAYSLAATLGIIVAGVGLQAPIVTMLAFVPMLLVAYAFRELNASNADCGTTFTGPPAPSDRAPAGWAAGVSSSPTSSSWPASRRSPLPTASG
ncbi:hypothetical protein ACFQ0Q_46860 [Streptomyces aureus]